MHAKKTHARLSMGFVLCLFLFFHSVTGTSTQDIIIPGQSIKDGETLISAGGSFELGFFSPGSSKNRYVGIWCKKVSAVTVVWVANREAPVSGRSGVLSITSQGILTFLNSNNSPVWTSNTSKTARDPVAQLLDSRNLVVQERNGDNLADILWESSDYPCDNLLPGMKLGRNFITGFERYISSWKSTEDPAPGQYCLGIDPRGYPRVVLKKGSEILYRGGSWNGLFFTGKPTLEQNPVYSYDFVLNNNEVYITYKHQNSSFISRYVLNPVGSTQLFMWTERKTDWEVSWTTRVDGCGSYAFCGVYATCRVKKSPSCACLEGFMPRSTTSIDSNTVDWSDGCVRRTPLACDGKDSFFKHRGLKFPDMSRSWANKSMNLQECEELCLRNCNCTAYANLDILKGTGCLIWFNELIDMTEFTEDGQDLYIRLAAPELDRIRSKRKSKEKLKAGIISISIVIAIGLMIMVFLLHMRKKKLRKEDEEKEEMELPMVEFATIANATDNFSKNNQLGRARWLWSCV